MPAFFCFLRVPESTYQNECHLFTGIHSIHLCPQVSFQLLYKPHWWNHVHILLFEWQEFNHQEHVSLKMLKTCYSMQCCSPKDVTVFWKCLWQELLFLFVKETDAQWAKRSAQLQWGSRTVLRTELNLLALHVCVPGWAEFLWKLSIFSPPTLHSWNEHPHI